MSAVAVGRGHKKASDKALIESYDRLGNVHKVAAEHGMGGGSVHERLVRLGKARRLNTFTDGERRIVEAYYRSTPADKFDLAALAKTIGRTKQFVCRKAGELGLTEPTRPMSAQVHKRAIEARPANPYSHKRGGVRPDIGPMYFRSGWEANYARYLNWLVARGEIDRWAYEPETYWFLKIKRGVRSYLPDFQVWRGEKTWLVEVKGYMDARSATKLRRMAKYYPAVELQLVGSAEYKALARSLSGLVGGWE